MYQMIFTSVVILLMSIALVKEWFRPSIVVFGALLLLVMGGCINTDEAFDGFSNHGMITVGFLFVISASLKASGLFERIVTSILGNGSQHPSLLYARLLFPVAGLSAFLNNTPIVASLIPIIKNWAKKYGLASSKLLMPVSYAAILGGTCTLIGTSTNLIVHGLLLENNSQGFSFFEISKIGIPVAVISLLFIILFGHFLLPQRKELAVQLGESTREFVVEMKVEETYRHLNKSVEDAHLRHLQGLFLFQIQRADQVIAPVGPEEKICLGDRLFFTGLPDTIFELQKEPGLQSLPDQEFHPKQIDSNDVRTFEAVVSSNSPLIGQTVRESQFRKRYQGAILAIHRSGSRINKKVGDIVFQSNDTLFVLAKKGFFHKWYHSQDFSLVSSSLEIFEKPAWKGNVSTLLLCFMVIVAALKLLPIVIATALTALLMVLIKIISPTEARKAVNTDVLFLIACSFGVAKALDNSGLAQFLALQLTHMLSQFGQIGIIAGLYVVTSALTCIITNNAVAAIMFPVALAVSEKSGIPLQPVMLTLVIGASSSFITPIGYQTNLMVFSPGGYRFKDFAKLGIPTNLVAGTVAVLTIGLLYF